MRQEFWRQFNLTPLDGLKALGEKWVKGPGRRQDSIAGSSSFPVQVVRLLLPIGCRRSCGPVGR